MKYLTILFCLSCFYLQAQRNIDLSYPIQNIEAIDFSSKWADIELTTSTDNNIHIKGKVSLNFDENNDWFSIDERTSDGVMRLSANIKNEDEIFNEIIAYKGDETFRIRGGKSWKESEKILTEVLGEDHDYKHFSHRPAIEISLVISVPQSVLAKLYTEHGDIDIDKCESAMDIRSQHGHIAANFDASPTKDCKLHSDHDFVELIIPQNTQAELHLMSDHGLLYTNFEASKINIKSFPTDRRQNLRGQLNEGEKVTISLSSDHDDVYLRGT